MAGKKEALLQSAEKLVGKGKIEAAIREYQKVLKKWGEDTNTLNLIGDLYGRLRKNAEAIRYYSLAAERYANDGFYVKAIALYKKVHRIEPGRMDAHTKLAELYHRQGLANEARAHYQTLADHYQRQKDAAAAIGIYQKMIDLEPGNPTPRAKLAELYKQEHLLHKAVEQYGEIAGVMLEHDQADQALQVYQRALDLDAWDVEFVRAGLIRLRERGAQASAEQFFTKAAQRNSSVEDLRPLLHGEIPSAPEAEVPQSAQPAAPQAAEPEAPAPQPAAPEAPAAPPPGEAQSAPPASAPPESPSAVPERAPEPAASPPPAAAPELPTGEDAPAPAVEELELEAPHEIELEVPGTPEAPEEVFPAPSADETAGAAPDAGSGEGGYEEFVLDFDAEDVPSTLVQPPADMLEDSPDLTSVQDDTGSGEIELDPTADLGSAGSSPDLGSDLQEVSEPFPGEQDQAASAAESQEFTFEPEPELEAPTLSPEDVDLELTDSQLVPETTPAEAPPQSPAPPASAPRAETAPGGGAAPSARPLDDLLAEAEVFVKYGLSEKAVDRLQEVLDLDPRHVGARVQLITVLAGQGEIEQVTRRVPELAQLAGETGASESWRETREKLEEQGYGFDGDTLVATPAGPLPGAAGAPAPELTPPSAVAPQPSELVDVTGLDEGAGEVEAPVDAFRTFDGLESAAEQTEAAEADPTSWLDDIGREPPTSDESGESLFDDEEELFDLGAELQDDLQEDEAAAEEPREQTLEEIVEGFKKGVAENLSPEDSDTHYNLGIAYREMMLLDEAIGEFQIAAKDPRLLVDCCAMLGQCFSEKGLPELALKWYRKALDSPDVKEEQSLGMLYEMANSYLALNDREAAYKTLVEIYGIKTTYRDVAAKMQQLALARSGS